MVDAVKPVLSRLLAAPENRMAFEALTTTLSGADLTSLLLEVFAARSSEVRPADVLRQYRDDRFVSPTPVDSLSLARLELEALETAAPTFEPVSLAPVAPFGAHAALGGTPQNNVITTSRRSEVVADPTNVLALEAAMRRKAMQSSQPRAQEVIQLAAVHRVARAQRFDGPRSFAHFSLLGLVSAGRDQGNFEFERQALAGQIRVLAGFCRNAGAEAIRVQLTPFTGEGESVCEGGMDDLKGDDLQCEIWRDREHGRGYYRNACFKLHVGIGTTEYELGDGGDVWWTQGLLQSRKERLMIGGLGLSRLALLLAETRQDVKARPPTVHRDATT